LPRIVVIVEGHGDVAALPILLRRIARKLRPGEPEPEIPKPIRVKRQKIVQPGELERAVELAGRQTGAEDAILILLDADSDCPKDLAPELLQRAVACREDRVVRVVLAKTEYEAWFLAAARSLAGQRGLDETLEPPSDPEAIADPKRWLGQRMAAGTSYRETLDQPALTARFDLGEARTAPSFDKLWREVASLLRPQVRPTTSPQGAR
jgi:Domain of unknown function (DUF4276)